MTRSKLAVPTLSGLLVLSAGGIVLEIALTRVLSVIYSSSFVYIALSIAILGLGLGAAATTLVPAWRRLEFLTLWASLAGLSGAALTLLIVLRPVTPPAVALSAFALPYVFIGVATAALFSRLSYRSNLLYCADLAGAGIGAVLAIPLLNALGGVNAMLAAAGLLSLAGLLFKLPKLGKGALTALLSCVLLLGLNSASPILDLDLAELNKPIASQLAQGGEIRATIWDAFARTDLVYRPDLDVYYLYIDGGAGSVVPNRQDAEVWGRDIGTFAFQVDPPKDSLVIGPGGGLDLALAELAAVTNPEAVELNRASIDLVNRLETVTGDIYGANVDLSIDEGRSFLRRSRKTFDLIFLSHVVAQASEARAYALSENSIYTVEAFEDYLSHLKPEGRLAVKLYDEATLTKAFLTALTALTLQGNTETQAASRMLALLDTGVRPPIPLLLVYNRSLDRQEAIRLARKAEELELALLYVPGLLARPPLDRLSSGAASIAELVAESSTNIAPTTDARPFFFHFDNALPAQIGYLLYGTLAVTALLILAFQLIGRRGTAPGNTALALSVVFLGAGFMALELFLLQNVKLFLGHPTLSLSTVLGALLLLGGLGSASGRGIAEKRELSVIGGASIITVLLLGLWTFVWPGLSDSLRFLAAPWRSLLTAVSLGPIALTLGLPFPLILKRLGRIHAGQVAFAWAVNGLTAVLGGVLSTMLALRFGYGAVLLLAISCYLSVAATALVLTARNGR